MTYKQDYKEKNKTYSQGEAPSAAKCFNFKTVCNLSAILDTLHVQCKSTSMLNTSV